MHKKQLLRLQCFDICCGGGGLSLGFSQAGANILGGIDIMASAVETCKKRHGELGWECVDLHDFVDKLSKDKKHAVRKANVILAGLPCQGFSVAGKGDPKDRRNYLYEPLLKLVSMILPSFVVFENVEGILHKKNSEIFKSICSGFCKLGYSVSYRVLNASAFGVPQVRRRVFLVACKNFPTDMVFESLRRKHEWKTVREALVGCSPNIQSPKIDHVFMVHGQAVIEKLRKLSPGGPISYRRLRWDTPAFTIICGHRALPIHPSEPRAISPREAARLQGFPDSYVFEGSVSRKIEQVANATAPPVAKEIAKAIVNAWARHSGPKKGIDNLLNKKGSDRRLSVLTDFFVEYHNIQKQDFQWRKINSEFHVMLAEMLLQRTDRFKVASVWKDLVKICTSVKKTSELSSSDMAHIFRRIGIFSRAETIIKLAGVIRKFYWGKVPKNWDELNSLPGIGQYIASAVRVIAYNEQDFPVDSNAFRFVKRYLGIEVKGKKSEAKSIREVFKRYVPTDRSKEFFFGFLDFMSEVCCYGKANCGSCKLWRTCYSMRGVRGNREKRARKVYINGGVRELNNETGKLKRIIGRQERLKVG